MADEVVVELYYVRGAHNSRMALANLDRWLRERFDQRPPPVERVEVFEAPGRALAAGIWLTPQLIVRGAGGEARLVGTMEDPVALERLFVPVADVAP